MGKPKKKERKQKINLVFDEAVRKDYLCGFRKRKLERKKKAQEELQRLLKEEKKRIKLENKESYKKLVVSSRPIPDIEQLLNEEYEDDDVNVRVVELSSDILQKNNVIIGENKSKEEVKKNTSIPKKASIIEGIPGMNTEIESEQDENEQSGSETNDSSLKSKKEIKRMLKHQATKKIQKSKVFQMKNKLERVKNKKKSQQKKSQLKSKGDPKKEKKSKKKSGKRKH